MKLRKELFTLNVTYMNTREIHLCRCKYFHWVFLNQIICYRNAPTWQICFENKKKHFFDSSPWLRGQFRETYLVHVNSCNNNKMQQRNEQCIWSSKNVTHSATQSPTQSRNQGFDISYLILSHYLIYHFDLPYLISYNLSLQNHFDRHKERQR